MKALFDDAFVEAVFTEPEQEVPQPQVAPDSGGQVTPDPVMPKAKKGGERTCGHGTAKFLPLIRRLKNAGKIFRSVKVASLKARLEN